MADLILKARTALALGLPNLARVIAYRAALRLGVHPVQQLDAAVPQGPFFRRPETAEYDGPAPDRWRNDAWYFGWRRVPLNGNPPDWRLDPFTGARAPGFDQPWWRIPDFSPDVGDVKAVWEPSRFDWVLAHALHARAGEPDAVPRLNRWLADWCAQNPPYLGPNWKCGQEAAIRVLHLALAALLLKQTDAQVRVPEPGLTDLLRIHLRRIAPTMAYAVAQDNNHGTSEAAALFVGGAWLHNLDGDQEAARWARTGRRRIEERVSRLVAADGSFSQYSVNYHRLMLETLSVTEVWRRSLKAPPFSSALTARCRAAAQWLYAFTDARTGNAPNIGANDGAHLLPIAPTGYRDYRPAVQLASALFLDAAAYPEGPWDAPLHALGLPKPDRRLPVPETQSFDDGGYALLRAGDARVYLRYPRYRFRPAHADALHLDLWLGAANVLRDGGSYSYAAASPWRSYFSGTASHNTVQFDERDQMPRLGRFLYGAWLETSDLEPPERKEGAWTWAAACRDWMGAEHRREVCLEPRRLRVTDRISGFRHKAVLRWRLAPGDWREEDGAWRCGTLSLSVQTEMPLSRAEMVEVWESRCYLKRDPLPVLEMETAHAGLLRTELSWTETPRV